MEQDLIRRAEELCRRSAAQDRVTHTGFLSPAEQYALNARPGLRKSLRLFGGGPDCERQVAFFLPDWLSPEDFTPQEYLGAFHLLCRFNPPSHRDILGSLLALGLSRWSLGDIYTQEEEAWFFCLPSVVSHIERELSRVGRGGVQVRAIPLIEVPPPVRSREPLSFTVAGLRLDAILVGTFHLSREEAAASIEAGQVALNYSPCQKPAALLGPGDVFSLRGHGKAALTDVGSKNRKDRIRITVEKYA